MAYIDQPTTVYHYDMTGFDRNTLVLGLGSSLVLKKTTEWQLGYRYSCGSSSSESHTLNLLFKQAF